MGSLLSLCKTLGQCSFTDNKSNTSCLNSCCFSHKTVILSPQPCTPRIRSAPQLYRRLTLAHINESTRNW